jgi:bifunctional enzyme CysN/CysC
MISSAVASPLPRFPASAPTERLTLVVAGHVDHGKSTIVGRLLADTGSLPQGKLDQIRELCARTARPFEYAFLLDALKEEQAQGITIDSARIFFRSDRRQYVIIDVPGHVEFLKNMVSGAARAEAALLVIDAREGIRENSRRHGFLLALLGIRQLAVLVNKLDLVGFDQVTFDRIEREYRGFLSRLGVEPTAFIPVSGTGGDNLVGASLAMPWYHGPSVLEALDGFRPSLPETERPFRMPVQSVFKFTEQGDDRRIVAGTIETGTVRVGDEVVFHPSGKRSRVRSIEAFNRAPKPSAAAGAATGFTLEDQIFVARGEIVARAGEPAPTVASRVSASVFWLGKRPLAPGRDYVLKLGTARVGAWLEKVHRIIDAAELEVSEGKPWVGRHEVADCVLALRTPIALDRVDQFSATSRFVLLDGYEISGGGVIRGVAGEDARRPPRLVIVEESEGDFGANAAALEPWLATDGTAVYRFSGRRYPARLAAAAEALLEPGVVVLLSVSTGARTELEPLASGMIGQGVEVQWVPRPQ